MRSENMKRTLAGLICGLLFGLGLAVGGMTDPANVIGFLDVASSWNPSLIFVMGGAVFVAFFGFRLVLKRRTPLFETRFFLPDQARIDSRLIIGAAIFGIGWGLSGYCPGPALASLSQPTSGLVVFLCASAAGAVAAQRFKKD